MLYVVIHELTKELRRLNLLNIWLNTEYFWTKGRGIWDENKSLLEIFFQAWTISAPIHCCINTQTRFAVQSDT